MFLAVIVVCWLYVWVCVCVCLCVCVWERGNRGGREPVHSNAVQSPPLSTWPWMLSTCTKHGNDGHPWGYGLSRQRYHTLTTMIWNSMSSSDMSSLTAMAMIYYHSTKWCRGISRVYIDSSIGTSPKHKAIGKKRVMFPCSTFVTIIILCKPQPVSHFHYSLLATSCKSTGCQGAFRITFRAIQELFRTSAISRFRSIRYCTTCLWWIGFHADGSSS